jgi:hypothetical protein
MERWSNGVMEYWSIGVLEYWSIGVLECWMTEWCSWPRLRRHADTPIRRPVFPHAFLGR